MYAGKLLEERTYDGAIKLKGSLLRLGYIYDKNEKSRVVEHILIAWDKAY